MKCKLFSKFKLIVIATLLVVLAGMIVFGIVGLNQTVDYKESYRLTVKVEDVLEKDMPAMKEAVDGYLEENAIEVVVYATETLNGGETIVYKLYEDASSHCDGIKSAVETAVTNGLVAEVDCGKFAPMTNANDMWLLISAGIAFIVIFLYSFFMDKNTVSGGLSTIIVSILSALLTLSLMAITRIPANPYWVACIVGSAILSAVLSSAITARFRDALKNVGNDGLSYSQIAGKEVKQSLLRGCFVLGAIVLASIVMVIVGNTYVKFLAVQILIAGISAVFSSLGWTGTIWAFFKGLRKDRKNKKIAQ